MSDLKISNLNKSFPGMDRPAVNNVSLDIKTGGLIAFLGRVDKSILFAKNHTKPIPTNHQISWYPQIEGIFKSHNWYPSPGLPKISLPITNPGPIAQKNQIKVIT